MKQGHVYVCFQESGCGWTNQSWTTLTGVKVSLMIAVMGRLLLQMGLGMQTGSGLENHTSAKHPKVLYSVLTI